MNEREAIELVPEYVLGILPDAERRAMAALLEKSPALDAEVRSAELALSRMPEALPAAPVTTNGRGRDRLLATLSGPDRFREFFPVLRGWFDLADDALRAVLARVDDREAAEPTAASTNSSVPGLRYFHFQSGPAALARESGCIILAPGARFPRHQHEGTERALVLQGVLLLDGQTHHAGTVIEAEAGTSHDFAAGPGRDLIAIVGHDGIRFERPKP